MKYDLVIFDLDATLTTRDTVVEGVLSRLTQDLPYPLSAKEIHQRFQGCTAPQQLKGIAHLQGGSLPDWFVPELQREYIAASEAALAPVRNVEAAIRMLEPLPVCLTSNGDPTTIMACLKFAGLDKHFDNRWFSAAYVQRPKPAPDLFHFAATAMDTFPGNCLVVEDSPIGAKGAMIAGMKVVGLTGGSAQKAAGLAKVGVTTLLDSPEPEEGVASAR